MPTLNDAPITDGPAATYDTAGTDSPARPNALTGADGPVAANAATLDLPPLGTFGKINMTCLIAINLLVA